MKIHTDKNYYSDPNSASVRAFLHDATPRTSALAQMAQDSPTTSISIDLLYIENK